MGPRYGGREGGRGAEGKIQLLLLLLLLPFGARRGPTNRLKSVSFLGLSVIVSARRRKRVRALYRPPFIRGYLVAGGDTHAAGSRVLSLRASFLLPSAPVSFLSYFIFT